MIVFDKNKAEALRGSYTSIARSVGCTREYVVKVLKDECGNVRGGEKAQKVKEKANQLLEVLEPAQ